MHPRSLSRLGLPALLTLWVGVPAHAQSISHQYHGQNPNDWFGLAVAGAGDIDGDFYDDLLVGAAFGQVTSGANAGYVRVFSGFDDTELSSFEGVSTGDLFGASVSGAGDFNGDGANDILIGVRYRDLFGTDTGIARVVSGLSGAVLLGLVGGNGEQLGANVSEAGDVNADGFDDVLIAGHGFESNRGRVRVVSGRNGTTLYNYLGDNPDDVLGWSMDSAGDVDNDGFADFILGSRSADSFGPDAGRARVYSGFDGSVLYEFDGAQTYDEFGFAVAGVGDVNDDWHDDVAISAFKSDGNGNVDSGSVRVISGIDGSVLYTLHGNASFDGFGAALCGAGDMNGDGIPDIAIGATGDDTNGTDAGSVRIVSGLDGTTLHTFFGDSAFDQLGSAVDGAGDPDRDGFTEVIAGAHRNDVGGADTGSALVLDLDAIGTPPRKWVFGAGCLGSAGMPFIDLRGRLAIGETCRVRLGGFPPLSTSTSFMIGDPAPVPLDVLGLTGCTLFQNPWTTVAVAVDAFGMVDIDITLPNDGAMIGLLWDYQGAALDFSAPQPIPLSLTNNMRLIIGN